MTPARRRRRKTPLIALVVLVILFFGVRYCVNSRRYVSTDDAFIEADVVAISPRVAANVAELFIDDNVFVNRGDLLLELDPRDFEARLDQARADLGTAAAQYNAAQVNVRLVTTTSDANVKQAAAAVRRADRQIESARHQHERAQAQAAAAEAELVRSAAEAKRYERVVRSGAASRQEADNALAAYRSAAAQLEAARQAEQAAAAAVERQHAQAVESRANLESARAAPDQIARSRAQAEEARAHIGQRRAAVRQAELNLSYTKFYAPVSGRITRKTVERGDYVQVGQTLFSIVPDSVFVVANYKETQLKRMRLGQPVTIHVDAYPDTTFTGRVQSIQAGSGAAFSLLPPENATGNYVKVVQRVPVKILIDGPPDTKHVFGPGMSVEPKVRVR